MLTIKIEGHEGYSYNKAIKKLFEIAMSGSYEEEMEMRKIICAIETHNSIYRCSAGFKK